MSSTLSSILGGAAPSLPTASSAAQTPDFRVRLRPQNPDVYSGMNASSAAAAAGTGAATSVMPATPAVTASNNILFPLLATNGLLFPYSPQIAFNQEVDYQTVDLVHTDMDWLGYKHTPSVTLSVTGKFTVQSTAEGLYALAAIHFLRVVSKMRFGQTDPYAGLPPPMLLFSGYGDYVFNDLKVILKSHAWNYDPAVDTVPITSPAGGSARLPAMFDLQLSLTVQQTPNQMRTQFNLDAFRSGALMRKGGWI